MAPEVAIPAQAQHPQDHSAPRARFWLRFDALLLDLIPLSVVGGALFRIRPTEPSMLNIVEGLFSVALIIAYFTYFEGSPSGQTPGKRILSIRVVDARTKGSIGFMRALARNVVAFFVSPILLLGYLWMLWDVEKQTWHDKVASSLVVPTDAYPAAKWPG